MTNAEVAKVFDEIADLLEMKGENQFKIRAYRQAARTIKQLPAEVERMVSNEEDLEEIPGIGDAIAAKIEDLVKTGHVKVHDELKAQFPQGILDILNIPGVGPRTVRSLALISELIYQAPASRRDPAVYSFAHGGKDGHPYPVDRATYDLTIDYLKKGLWQAKVGQSEKLKAMKRLNSFYNTVKI